MQAQDIPYGHCQCGCGQKTRIAQYDHSKSGHRQGEPVRYINGHQNRGVTKASFGHCRRGKLSLTYNSWRAMCDRCRNPNNDKYRYYGGRGIKICAAWQKFANFLTSVGERPSRKYSIDRINVNGHYSCGACAQCLANGWPMNGRWATQGEQLRNARPRSLKPEKTSRHCMVLIAALTTSLSYRDISDMAGYAADTAGVIIKGRTATRLFPPRE